MIASVILAMAAAATMGIVGGAQASVFNADRRWNNQHVTNSIVEFYLLAGPHAYPPQDLLPQGYSASCELLTVDDVHEEAQQPLKKWLLGEYLIQVTDSGGELVSETRVRKMLREEDFQ